MHENANVVFQKFQKVLFKWITLSEFSHDSLKIGSFLNSIMEETDKYRLGKPNWDSHTVKSGIESRLE